MIQTHSHDPDVAAAAEQAAGVVRDVLASLPPAESFDYGGHILQLGDYGMCERCTRPIAEAQQAARALLDAADSLEDTDPTIAEHVELAGELLKLEAHAAEIRAEFHNGHNSEAIINTLLGYIHDRAIHDSYDHSHKQGN
ncbi:MAG TPA: hypothetical protein VD735_03645 [Candidatus Saccharimonadales bacterium]|nr:hypothetical protein [Candidatus Saccharimonadales bacterium]